MSGWSKATYGGSDSKKGGGKLDAIPTKGNKGLNDTSGVSKSNPATGPIISPVTTSGDKGIIKGSYPTAPPPKS